MSLVNRESGETAKVLPDSLYAAFDEREYRDPQAWYSATNLLLALMAALGVCGVLWALGSHAGHCSP